MIVEITNEQEYETCLARLDYLVEKLPDVNPPTYEEDMETIHLIDIIQKYERKFDDE